MLPASELEAALSQFSEEEASAAIYDWRSNARPNQIIPGTDGASETRDDWVFWLVLAGRGFGKTRTGAETIVEWSRDPKARILIIGPTWGDVVDVMVEGESGIMACYPPAAPKPVFQPSKKRIIFLSGARAILRSADEPNRLRGPQFTKFWADELCAWQYPQEAWDQIQFGFRGVTKKLRGIITTTPKPIKTLKTLISKKETVTTRGSSYENRTNLADLYLHTVIAPYEGTRLGRQEINAEILEDIPGALWTRGLIDGTREDLVRVRWDCILRIVVAIDPAVTSNPESDETGIVVAALTENLHVLILDDLSARVPALQWAKIAIAAYKSRRADRIVGEVNNGGDLVARNLYGVDPSIPFRAVRASRGKYIRAEPVAALYEQGRIHHVGFFDALESQMCGWTPQSGEKSPDRLDALVWAVTELLLDPEQLKQRIQFGQPVQISPI